MGLQEITKKFEDAKAVDPKKARELGFAIAVHAKNNGDKKTLEETRNELLALTRKIGSDTMEQCATSCEVIEGICIPDLLHEEVYQQRLGIGA